MKTAEIDQSKHEIRGVELFRTGVWNGDKYSTADLDEIVSNFDRVGFPVPLKLGHQEVSGGMAFGWVHNLRRIGDKLIGDFKDVSKKIFDMIKSRSFDTISAEIFWNLRRGGRLFRRVLKAVALLGAETHCCKQDERIRHDDRRTPCGLRSQSRS